jgi:hypothetical protein
MSAVFAANIVLVSYVVVAFREDAADARIQPKPLPKKKQQ